MLVVVTCPKCEKKANVPDTSVGRRIRCSGCQAIFLAVDENASPSPPPPPQQRSGPPPLPQQYEPNEPADDPAASSAPEPLGPAAPPSRLGFWIAVVLVALLMVGGGIFAAVYFNKK